MYNGVVSIERAITKILQYNGLVRLNQHAFISRSRNCPMNVIRDDLLDVGCRFVVVGIIIVVRYRMLTVFVIVFHFHYRTRMATTNTILHYQSSSILTLRKSFSSHMLRFNPPMLLASNKKPAEFIITPAITYNNRKITKAQATITIATST